MTQDLAAGSRCRAPWRRGSSRSGDEFAAVAAAEGGHHAAQVAAYRHGEQVVNLWTGLEITGDSLLGAYSTSKGAAYLIVALLVQEGALDWTRRSATTDRNSPRVASGTSCCASCWPTGRFYLGLPEDQES